MVELLTSPVDVFSKIQLVCPQNSLRVDVPSFLTDTYAMSICVLTDKASEMEIDEMLLEYDTMIKIVVDIRKGHLVGGGDMHADCEQVLIENGSEQDDLWGANWYPDDQEIAYESLINIRPSQGNRGILIQDEAIRERVLAISRRFLGAPK